MRIPVIPRRAYRLLNHGPTTLITSAHAGRRNIMAAAWVMPLDFDPPRLAAVIATGTHTRSLVDASRELVVQVPVLAQLDLVHAVGNCTGAEVDKFARFGVATSPSSVVAAPLVDGCAAWLECRARAEGGVEGNYDLFILDVVAAWADETLFDGERWTLDAAGTSTLHHVARGEFIRSGPPVMARGTG